jgi:hypothetical protein
MIDYAESQKELSQLASQHHGERILQVLRSEPTHTKGVALDGICGEDWEYYDFWIKLESHIYLSITPNLEIGGVSSMKTLEELVTPVETMSDWIVQQQCCLLGYTVRVMDWMKMSSLNLA